MDKLVSRCKCFASPSAPYANKTHINVRTEKLPTEVVSSWASLGTATSINPSSPSVLSLSVFFTTTETHDQGSS